MPELDHTGVRFRCGRASCRMPASKRSLLVISYRKWLIRLLARSRKWAIHARNRRLFAMQSPSAAGSASPAVGPNAYREYLKAAGFSKEELKAIYAFNDRRAVLDFLGALATTAAVPWLYWIYPSWITVVVCVVLSVHNFNALTQ